MHASLPNIHTDRKQYRMGFATRYVPSNVIVYPNTDVVQEYGGIIPLDNFGNVLVSGKDMTGGVNKYRDTTLKGTPYIVKC